MGMVEELERRVLNGTVSVKVKDGRFVLVKDLVSGQTAELCTGRGAQEEESCGLYWGDVL